MYTKELVTNGLEIKKATGMQEDRNYLVFEDWWFDEGTDEGVIAGLLNARADNARIRIFYGNTDKESLACGTVSDETYEVLGYVGRTTGSCHMPILVYNKRSYGGGLISTTRILRIVGTQNHKEYYKHPRYVEPIYEVVGAKVFRAKPLEMQIRLVTPEDARVYADSLAKTCAGKTIYRIFPSDPCTVWRAHLQAEPCFDFTSVPRGPERAACMRDFLAGKRNSYC